MWKHTHATHTGTPTEACAPGRANTHTRACANTHSGNTHQQTPSGTPACKCATTHTYVPTGETHTHAQHRQAHTVSGTQAHTLGHTHTHIRAYADTHTQYGLAHVVPAHTQAHTPTHKCTCKHTHYTSTRGPAQRHGRLAARARPHEHTHNTNTHTPACRPGHTCSVTHSPLTQPQCPQLTPDFPHTFLELSPVGGWCRGTGRGSGGTVRDPEETPPPWSSRDMWFCGDPD